MLKFSCFITGDDYKMVVTDTPKSKQKIYTLSSLVLIPTLTWIGIGFIMGNSYLKFNTVPSLLLGFVTGLVIFIIERAIIMSSGNSQLINFRYLIGIIAALLASMFIDEAIFRDDITNQVAILKQKYVSAKKDEASSTYNKEFNVDSIAAATKLQKEQFETLNKSVIAEAEGNSPSRIKGVGAITKLKKEQASDARELFTKTQGSLTELLMARARRINNAENEATINFKENGFLTRIKALYQLVFSDWAIFLTYLLFTTLVAAFEFMVIKFKLNSEETNYERRIKMIEKIGEERIKHLQHPNSLLLDPGQYLPQLEQTRRLIDKNSSLFN